MADVEAIIEPDGVTDDVRRESVTFICIHPGIVSQTELSWQYPINGRFLSHRNILHRYLIEDL